MSLITEKLDQERKDLLDLGLRNTLINYRELKSKGVNVIDARPKEIFQNLVEEGRALSFAAAERQENSKYSHVDEHDEPQIQELNSTLEKVVDDDSAIRNQNDLRLQTPYTQAHLQRRLLNTFYTARSSIEEQGVNILFLALGMLTWYEDHSSDIPRKAPLVLVPVGLSRSSVRSGFKMEYTGDEIDTNLSLQMKLKTEFGIDFPSIPENENGLDLQEYFKSVASAVKRIPRWEVDSHAVALGFFSFSKLLMYKDLDEENWPADRKPKEHKVLRSVLHEGFRSQNPLFDESESLDEYIDPSKLYQVRDADSSQTTAILESKADRSLVIQGPPGTGKSQTITNLIAEAIADGKTVLFVSEKMAALEVVKRRLDEVGLGDVCLELHSHKTKKKVFLSELEKTLALGKPRHQGRDQSVEELRRAREHLNSYCQAVHAPIGQSGVTPYHAYGVFLDLQERLNGISIPEIKDIQLQEWTRTEYDKQRSLVEELQAHISGMGVPCEHPFWGSGCKVFLPSNRQSLEDKCHSVLERLEPLRETARELATIFNEQEPEDLDVLNMLSATADQGMEAPELTGLLIRRKEWNLNRDALEKTISIGRLVQELHQKFDPLLLPEALDAQVLEARKDLAIYKNKWWRLFSSRYRLARKEIKGLYSDRSPGNPDQLIETADAILAMQRWDSNPDESNKLIAELCASAWKGWESDWDYLEAVGTYLADTHKKIDTGAISSNVLEYLEHTHESSGLSQIARELKAGLEGYQGALDALIEEIKLDQEQRFGEGGLSSLLFDSQEELFRNWKMQAPRLQEVVTWNHFQKRMHEYRLDPIIEIAATWRPASEHLVHVLGKARHEQLLEKAMKERSALAGFDGNTHAHQINKFREQDKKLLELNRAYLARLHWEGLPGRSGTGQVGILYHEFAKKKRHRPIRRLMQDAGNALQAIKPVFMMSPLSVAAYIPPGSVHFDMVVFDEASQVRPVDAFGAILRGEQSIVVGDSRQLPPTRFFDKVGLVDDAQEDNWDSGTSDLESVLGLFSARGASDTMLLWHYRSRHESLITVSNHAFYEDRLIVFPAPDRSQQDVGLVFHHLPEAAYERGKAVNRAEAVVVAKAVMQHARNCPDLTLGVAAFSISQMRAIQDQLEILRHEDTSCEGFFAAHPEEPFFVKNLENVQGDERDVIFISIGFGRTREGYLAMNFGPLNQEGGERRLNVLITRARRRCEVFSNLLAEDIDLNRSSARGVAALKTFLKYAATGTLDVPRALEEETESPFEEAVRRALTGLGHEVHAQVGSAGFRIDLAVVDPESPGRYLLGIECDGASYHSAKWARDRDRLRQEVLESLGWRIHRVWSTDWFRSPEKQLRRIIESIEEAKVSRKKQPKPANNPPTSLEEENPGNVNPHNPIKRENPSATNGEALVKPYHIFFFTLDLYGLELHEASALDLADSIQSIVAQESPVHLMEVTSRIVSAAGVQRTGRRIRSAIERAVQAAEERGSVIRKDDFLWHPEMKVPVVRDRSKLPSASREILRVAPEEIEEAVKLVVKQGVGVTWEEALIEACRLLGYARVTDKTRQPFEQSIQRLLKDKHLILRNGYLMRQWGRT